jgi:hypothetical protein
LGKQEKMRDLINLIEAIEKGCPPATQSIDLNLKNRQKAIDEYHYGPLNPNEPNEAYWTKLADKWNTDDIESVKKNRCGNCAAFDISEDMLDCIARGIGSEPGSDPHDTVDAGQLGYCKFLKFKCAAKRTCDAWVEGGPVTEEQLDELNFLGSQCTKDCSGHRAGYEWSKSKGGQVATSPFSPSFNKGSQLHVDGK